MTATAKILVGDVRERLAELPDESVHLVMTSPPYYALRSYLPADHPDKALEMGIEGALDCLSWATGAEPCRACWICSMRDTFAAVRRVLRREGVMFVNVGDSYACKATGSIGNHVNVSIPHAESCAERSDKMPVSLKPKDMCLAPSRLALALQASGWYVRSIAPWVKRGAMPSSVTDRPSTSLEWMIMLTRSARYHWDQEAVRRGDLGTDHARHVLSQPEPSGGIMCPHKGLVTTNGRNGQGRNLRDSDWWFDSVGMLLRDEVLGFDVVSEPSTDAHYASYPRRLVRDVVLAGTSGAGVCSVCQSPWVRVVEKRAVKGPVTEYNGTHKQTDPGANGRRMLLRLAEGRAAGLDHDNPFPVPQTLGFRPSCPHVDAPRIPATILDPFCGRGTTGVVALEYGRSFIGIELSEPYAAMARRRLAAVEAQPLLDVTAPEPAPHAEQMAMEVE